MAVNDNSKDEGKLSNKQYMTELRRLRAELCKLQE